MAQIVKVGDIVRVKTYEQLVKEQGEDSQNNLGWVYIKEDKEYFTTIMRKFSGRIFKVTEIEVVENKIKDIIIIGRMDNYVITPSMIDIVEMNLEG